MKYEVTEQEIKVTDGINTYLCKYDDLPQETMPLVEESKKSLLQDIDLNDMLTNLDNSAELIYIAFCALHGKSMQSDLDGLQVNLLKLCAKSKVTMTTFRDRSKEITQKILESYSWMKSGFLDEAKTIFHSTATYAGQMAKTSQELSQSFEHLANQTTDVLKKVEVEHANEIQNKENIENELKAMEAEKAKQESLAKSLNDDIVAINIEYQEEKDKLASAEKREMTMGIVSAVTGALSLGISSALSMATQSQKSGYSQDINALNAQQQENQNKEKELNTKKDDVQKRIDGYKAELVDLENSLSILDEQLTHKTNLFDNETNEELKQSLQKEIGDLKLQQKNKQHEIDSKNTQIKQAESELKDYSAQLAGISSALQSITESLKQSQEKAASAVEAHSQKVTSLLNKKLEMEKQKRESLAEMEKFVLLIKQNNHKKITTDTAIEMLLVAIKCLKKVAASLITASLFWESLKQYCERLAESTINQLLVKINDYPEEKQMRFITNQNFVSAIIQYASQWAAMYYVCDEYYQAANQTYQHTETNFQSMPSKEEAMQIAQTRSSTILAGITAQKRDLDLSVIEIENKKKELVEQVQEITGKV